MLSARSLKNLEGVHPDLVRVVKHCDVVFGEATPFIVIEGMRSLERQKRLFASGASKTMKSRHLTGHAVDVCALLHGEIEWAWPLYAKIAASMKKAAADCDVAIEWGGDWKKFRDGPHWQLPFANYPA